MNVFRKKIAAKLSLQTGLLVLVMVVAIGALSYFKAATAITAEVEQKITSKLELLVNQLQGQMDIISGKLDMIGKLDMVKDFADKPESTAPITAILKTIQTENTDYVETLFIADKSGTIKMDGSFGEYIGVNISDRAYFKEAMAGKAVWSEVVTSKKTNKPVRVYAYPVKNKNGVTVGIISAAIKLDPIAEAILATKEGEKGYAYLVDNKGTILIHPVEERVGKDIETFNIPELTAAKPDMIAGKAGKVLYSYDGIKKLNVYVPFGDMSVSLNAASAEYLAPVTEMGEQIAIYGFIFFLLGVGLSILIAIILVKKIKNIQDVVSAASKGDLTIRVAGKRLENGDELDQMGLSVNQMMTSMNHVISEIFKASETMSSTSQQMAASAVEGGKAASEVTAAIQEISAGLNEQSEFAARTDSAVAEMKTKIASTTQETEVMADRAQKVMLTAMDSQQHMKSTMTQMDDIQASSKTTYGIVQTLSGQSEKIGQISLAISAIADQTNLLALNAAIEAARAGEQGKGFAVVAEEIRKLASESMTSAENIGKLIDQIQNEIKRAEAAIHTESDSISKGVAVIGQTESAFVHIIEAIEETLNIMHSVLGCTNSMTQSSDVVAKSVAYISEVTQEASASAEEVNASTEEQNAIAEEIASAAEHLSQLAVSLLEQVSLFKVSR